MPTFLRPDEKPVVQFDPTLEISPFALFRLLRDGQAPVLIDARAQPAGVGLAGALPRPDADWQPPEGERVVVFDDDGSEAEPLVRRLTAEGFHQVRMLFGGLELYAFALDPQVVGEETYLREI